MTRIRPFVAREAVVVNPNVYVEVAPVCSLVVETVTLVMAVADGNATRSNNARTIAVARIPGRFPDACGIRAFARVLVASGAPLVTGFIVSAEMEAWGAGLPRARTVAGGLALTLSTSLDFASTCFLPDPGLLRRPVRPHPSGVTGEACDTRGLRF